ncbi:MAG: C cytochromes biosynthesis protein, partial [Acidobacteria bacterium]
MLSRNSLFKRGSQAVLLCLGLFVFLGAGDESARFNELGHRLMCVRGCKQILLEC